MQRTHGAVVMPDPEADAPGVPADRRPDKGRQPLRTEFSFELPRGYVDQDGTVHKSGVMRLATARDELLPLYDARVQENAAYTTVVLLGRVITSLGTLGAVTSAVVENMFASDVAFLQDFYRRINAEGHTRIAVTCPECSHRFTADLAGGRLGES
ncbi:MULTISPECIES: hypothetical protein [unclassified Arthrobacter]|uniref:hypothetical protein n=1 Tax=unclassified Arthrobacter TaxID=235627 RepID=UPI001DA566A7|nr:hypothetical protein [Arthrobacter sp. Bi26]CAH0132657.1 hypothetical protein SRABI26_00268 [Arthrobacter sp. Bi26]